MLPTLMLYLPLAVSCCAASAQAWRDGALPRGWAHWHRSDAEFHRLRMPLLYLPSADPVSYLEQHGRMLGHTARNVMHIGPEVRHHLTCKLQTLMCRATCSCLREYIPQKLHGCLCKGHALEISKVRTVHE